MQKPFISITVKLTSPKNEFLEILNSKIDMLRFRYIKELENTIKEKIQLVKEFNLKNNKNIQVQLDVPIGKAHLGKIKDNINIKKDIQYFLIQSKEATNKKEIPIKNKEFFSKIKIKDELIIGDNQALIKVVNVENNKFIVESLRNSQLKSWQSIIFLNKMHKQNHKNINNAIKFCNKTDVNWISISFVNSQQIIKEVKKKLNKSKLNKIKVLAKIEDSKGIKNIKEIIKVSDGIKIARGDLPIFSDYTLLGIHQKKIIKLCKEKNKFCIISTGIIESLDKRIKPIAAEILDITNIIIDGANAIQLCEEVISDDPLYPIKILQEIINNVFNNLKTSL